MRAPERSDVDRAIRDNQCRAVGLESETVLHRHEVGSANRGALGQNLANCLANRDGMAYDALLGYFYGADIEINNESSVPVPVVHEDDPAAAPQPDPTPSTDPGTTDPGTTDPGTTPSPVDMSTTPQDCWSYTLQAWVANGACVLSSVDSMWYQCVQGTGFEPGVDTDAGTGPAGACTYPAVANP